MARIRSLKPEFWTDSKIVQLSAHARLLFMGAWNFADDVGVLEDDPLQLKLRVLPADDVDAEALLDELIDKRLMRRAVTADGTNVLVIPRFNEHQKPNRRSEPTHGEPSTFTYDSRSTHTQRSESSVRAVPVEEGRGEEGRGNPDARAPAREDDEATTTFEPFWADYPPRDGKKIGRADALTQWRKLTRNQRDRAVVGARNLAASDQLPKDAHRFLRRSTAGAYPFDDWQKPAARDGPRTRDLPRSVREHMAYDAQLQQAFDSLPEAQ